jgi:Ca2+-binding RTX toxin-like protein
MARVEIHSAEHDALAGLPAAKPTEDDDVITGGKKAQKLAGRGGDDLLEGRGGDDTLNGGAGDDTLNGGNGSDWAVFRDRSEGGDINLSTGLATFQSEQDTLISIENITGSSGNDIIVGSLRTNRLNGGDGDDSIFGGRSDDRLDGGAGDDRLHGGEDQDALFGGRGADFLIGDAGDDTLSGGADDDALYGAKGDDRLKGDGGDDALFGGSGADTLFGGSGQNGLSGGSGDDVFRFSDGVDFVTSGAGADTVVIARSLNQVRVADHEAGVDRIALDVANPQTNSVDRLIETGRLTIEGGNDFTLLTFGSSEVRLDGVAVDDFMTSDIALI